MEYSLHIETLNYIYKRLGSLHFRKKQLFYTSSLNQYESEYSSVLPNYTTGSLPWNELILRLLWPEKLIVGILFRLLLFSSITNPILSYHHLKN